MAKDNEKRGFLVYATLEEQLGNVQITPKGIEMLSDSGMAEKVDNLLKGILSIG